jgi:Cu/Ag efflux protein CusF
MRPITILAIAVTAAIAPPTFAQAQAPTGGAMIATEPGKGVAMQAVKASATVEAVDKATRTVKLKMPKGDIRSVVAGEDVKNFDQIKAGDTVTVEYVEALSLELKKDGKAVVGRTQSGALERSQPGKKPGGVAMREIVAVVDVVEVDNAKKSISVKNGQGETLVFPIRDPEQLKLIKKGDQIQATYTEAVAISLKPAAAPAKAPPAAPAKK